MGRMQDSGYLAEGIDQKEKGFTMQIKKGKMKIVIVTDYGTTTAYKNIYEVNYGVTNFVYSSEGDSVYVPNDTTFPPRETTVTSPTDNRVFVTDDYDAVARNYVMDGEYTWFWEEPLTVVPQE